MGTVGFDFLISIAILAVYGFIFIMAILFTFFLDTYIKIEDTLKLNIISNRIITPLEINIDWFNNWAIRHNKIVGIFLISLSLIDLTALFYISTNINSLI